MIRGIKIFRCPKCGKIFIAPDVEYRATAFSSPMPCPKCGAQSAPLLRHKEYTELGIIKKDKTSEK